MPSNPAVEIPTDNVQEDTKSYVNTEEVILFLKEVILFLKKAIIPLFVRDNLGNSALPVLAGSLFIDALKPNTSPSIALATLMGVATSSPFLSEILKVTGISNKTLHNILGKLSAMTMLLAVTLMMPGTLSNFQESQNAITSRLVAAVPLFFVYTGINVAIHVFNALQDVNKRNAILLFANLCGLGGSIGFASAQSLSRTTALEKNDQAMATSSELIMFAALCFIYSTMRGVTGAALALFAPEYHEKHITTPSALVKGSMVANAGTPLTSEETNQSSTHALTG